MADEQHGTPGTVRSAGSEIADIITTGRARQLAPSEILDRVWDAASAWIPDDPLANAPAELVGEATAFMRDATWTYANTMADNPHWYVVETKVVDPRVGALTHLLRHHSRMRRWHGHPYRALDLDGWSIWDIWPVINRKPTRFAGWDGDPEPPENWLPADMRRNLRGDEVIAGPGGSSHRP